MNILFVTIAWPDPGERNLYSDLVEEFAANGHNMYVLCSDPNTPKTWLDEGAVANVIRVRTMQVRKANKVRKAFALTGLGRKLRTTCLRHWSSLKFDLIISHSPPVTLAILLRDLKNYYRAPLYYLLKDIWPQGPVDLGLVSRYNPAYFYFRYKEIQTYKTADWLGCMSAMNVSYVLRHNLFLNCEKVEICPNTIKPRNFEIRTSPREVRARFGVPEESTVFILSGNLGRAHGLPFYLEAIEKMKTYGKAFFVIGGAGSYFEYVTHEVKRRGLQNVVVYSRLPIADFDDLLSACDVGVVLLHAKYTVPQFPSRVLAYLEASKPVLCAVNVDTDIGVVVENAGCGINTVHGNLDSFERAVRAFCELKGTDRFEEMGRKARALLERDYPVRRTYEIIVNRLSRVDRG